MVVQNLGERKISMAIFFLTNSCTFSHHAQGTKLKRNDWWCNSWEDLDMEENLVDWNFAILHTNSLKFSKFLPP